MADCVQGWWVASSLRLILASSYQVGGGQSWQPATPDPPAGGPVASLGARIPPAGGPVAPGSRQLAVPEEPGSGPRGGLPPGYRQAAASWPGCRPGWPGCRPGWPGCRPWNPGLAPQNPGCRPRIPLGDPESWDFRPGRRFEALLRVLAYYPLQTLKSASKQQICQNLSKSAV